MGQFRDTTEKTTVTNRHLARQSYLFDAKHLNDNFKNLGFNYQGRILRKTTSPEIWANPLQGPFYTQIEAMITYVLEQVKYIKKTFSIAHEKNTTNIN